MKRTAMGIGLSVLASVGAVGAADWTGWRGPERDGAAVGVAAPDAWPEELQPHWRVRVGSGHSALVVAGVGIFVQSRQEGDEVVRALEPRTGKVLWEQRYPVGFKTKNGFGSRHLFR